MHKEAAIREPLILGDDVTYSKISDDVLSKEKQLKVGKY